MLLRFARGVVETRGRADDHDLGIVRMAGFDGIIAQVAASVAPDDCTRYFNVVAGNKVDFP